MKFAMKGISLLNAIDKVVCVATKGIKHEFEQAGRITMEAASDKLLLRASNGYLDIVKEITTTTEPTYTGSVPGTVTTDVAVLRRVVKAALANSDGAIQIELDGSALIIQNDSTKRKARAKIDVLPKHLDFKIKKAKGFSYSFDTSMFREAISNATKYITKLDYKIRYKMICMHFLQNEIRFISGCGCRFVISSYKLDAPNQDIQNTDGIKHIIPADQANIIMSACGDVPKMTITYENETSCFIDALDGTLMHLTGIPNEPYVAYEKHAFGREPEVIATDDIAVEDFAPGAELLISVRDKSTETEGRFLSNSFIIKEDGIFHVSVDEGRLTCDYDTTARYQNIKNAPVFKSQYAVDFFCDVATAAIGYDIVRFHCINERETLIAEPKFENREANPAVRLFFASALLDKE